MKLFFSLAACFLSLSAVLAQDATITLDSAKSGPPLSPWLYGIFFEEINHAGDGGLNPEKLRGTEGWDGLGSVAIKTSTGKPIEVAVKFGERGGIVTEGYWGIGVQKGKRYLFRADLTEGARVRVALVAPNDEVLAEKEVLASGLVALTLIPKRTESRARLALTASVGSSFTLGSPSLLPQETFGQSRVRKDLGELVAAMKPSFVRFPGGCFVEGDKLANRFQWKNTVGPRAGRKSNQCLWGYSCTNGLGFHEFLQWSEDMRAEPLFVVSAGMSHTDMVPMDRMGEIVQEALDAVEYANGDPKTTKWGAERAKNGHPKPFGLKLIEIGNENGGPRYDERYKLIYDALKKKHPELVLIAGDWGGLPKSAPVDVSDEHFYLNPTAMQLLSRRYDQADRKGPKVYLGEYAVTQGAGQGNLIAALSEAALMTGLERNADLVTMASYAPLLVNASNRAWNPDAIVFDSLKSFGTPSYWVQRLFSGNRGDVVVPSRLTAKPVPVKPAPGGVGVGTWRTDAEFADVHLDGKPVALTPAQGTWAKTTESGWRQSELADDRRAYGGDRTASGDYTLTLRARKNDGAEGFLVMFRVGGEGDWFWWNLGGWNNSRHAVERAQGGSKSTVTRDVSGRIETGRWYDIKIECQGERVRCFLDGALIHDFTVPPPPGPLHAVVTRDTKAGELLIKLVNVGEKPADIRLNLGGATLTGKGTAETLSGSDPLAENSFDNPTRLAPIKKSLSDIQSDFSWRAPAWSVSILRLKTK